MFIWSLQRFLAGLPTVPLMILMRSWHVRSNRHRPVRFEPVILRPRWRGLGKARFQLIRLARLYICYSYIGSHKLLLPFLRSCFILLSRKSWICLAGGVLSPMLTIGDNAHLTSWFNAAYLLWIFFMIENRLEFCNISFLVDIWVFPFGKVLYSVY